MPDTQRPYAHIYDLFNELLLMITLTAIIRLHSTQEIKKLR